MSARVDGSDWNSALRVSVLEGGYLIITGTAADGKIISITIMGNDEGSYKLSILPVITEFAATYVKETSVDGTYIATTGEVVLTKVDKQNKSISGEFFFTASNLTGPISVTNGIFTDIKYTEN